MNKNLTPDRLLLNIETVCAVTDDISRTTIWRKIKSGDFPEPVKVSTHMRRWRRSDIEFWAEDPETYKIRKRALASPKDNVPNVHKLRRAL